MLLPTTMLKGNSRTRPNLLLFVAAVFLFAASSALASLETAKSRPWYVTEAAERNGVRVDNFGDTPVIIAVNGSSDTIITDGEEMARDDDNVIDSDDELRATEEDKTASSVYVSPSSVAPGGHVVKGVKGNFSLGRFFTKARSFSDVFSKRSLAPVVAPLLSGVQAFSLIQQGLNNIVAGVLSYVAVQSFVILLNLLFWDYTKTAPQEKLTAANLIAVVGSLPTAVYNMIAVYMTALVYSFLLLIPPIIFIWFPSVKTALLSLGKKRRKRRSLIGTTGSGGGGGGGSILSTANRDSAIGEWDEESTGRFFTLPWTAGNWTQAIRAWICPYCVTRVITFNTISLIAGIILWSFASYTYPNNWASGGKKKRRRRSDWSEESDRERAKRAYNQKDEYVGLVEELQHALYRSFVKYGGGVDEEEYREKREEGLALEGTVAVAVGGSAGQGVKSASL